MLTREPTAEMMENWRAVWSEYKDKLVPCRKSGKELLDYVQNKYVLMEIFEARALEVIALNVTENEHLRMRLGEGETPNPRAFFLENEGAGAVFYSGENRDSADVWGGDIERIFVGIDINSGFYIVEGSTMLWDELCAFQGVDEADIANPFCVAEYISCLKRFDKMDL